MTYLTYSTFHKSDYNILSFLIRAEMYICWYALFTFSSEIYEFSSDIHMSLFFSLFDDCYSTLQLMPFVST